MKKTLPAFTAILALAVTGAWACTVTMVGKDASADGSVMTSHSDDGLGDGRMIFVPAMDHPPGSLRPVYYSHCASGYLPEWGATEAHRLATDSRGPGYVSPEDPPSVPIGFIPQVPHTYAYFDANYGVMNEHQLSIAECTDLARVEPPPEPGKRLFYSAELSRVALERCTTSREAVSLMGELIDRYGLYSTGETLLVADSQEGWVFEMCPYDMDGTDGVWVAKRLPDDEVFVAANQFRIREIIEDSQDMLHSQNIFEVARNKGWWKPEDGKLDWTAVYGGGEFHHPYYSLRRVWRAMSLLAPSRNLPAWVEGPNTRAYPFSIKPDHKVTPANIFAIHRDNYEGTEFDLSVGLAAGPFGCPNRFEGQAEGVANQEGKLSPLNGAFERPLNIYRCVYAYVNQSRSWLPDAVGGLTWYGPDRPATAVLMPLYAGVTNLPESIQRCNLMKFDRQSMWTAFNFVANYAMLKYKYMIQDIQKERNRFEAAAFGTQGEREGNAAELWKQGKEDEARAMLTRYCSDHAAAVLDSWWKLAETLYCKYNDGYLNTRDGLAQQVFYPAWWLEQVGYGDGPTSYLKPSGNP